MRTTMKMLTVLRAAAGGAAPQPATAVLVDGNASGGVADSLTPTVTWTPSADDLTPGNGAYTYSVSVTLNGTPVALDNATGIGGDVASYIVDPTTGTGLALSATAYSFTVTVTRVSDSATATSEVTTAIIDPRSIPGLTLWLDASDASTLFQDSAGTTPAIANGDPVGMWADKSGSGNHATVTVENKRPHLELVEGVSQLVWDGEDDALTTPEFMSYPFSLCWAARQTDASPLARVCALGATSNYDFGGFTGSQWSFYQDEIAAGVKVLGGSTLDWSIVSVGAEDATGGVSYIDGAAGAAWNPLDGMTIGKLHIGAENEAGGNSWNGAVNAMLCYANLLNEEEFLHVWGYLATQPHQ